MQAEYENRIVDMPRNIEIKARVADLDALRQRVIGIAEDGPSVLDQEDTFFHCAIGRLKVRRFSPTEGELIYYQRADEARPKESRYLRAPTHEPENLIAVLAAAFGVRAVVRKRREVYLVGQTRVHVDRVQELGDFIELEVVLGEGQSVAAGIAVARQLMGELQLTKGDLVAGAYVDLL